MDLLNLSYTLSIQIEYLVIATLGRSGQPRLCSDLGEDLHT